MTTITVKGKVMAADTQMDDEGVISNIRKIFKVRGDLIGFAGSVSEGLKFVEWYINNDLDDITDLEEISLDETGAIVLTKSGKILTFETHLPIEILDDHFAIGSGAQAAMAAMDCGHDPITAIKIASKRDAYTSSNVIYEEIE